MNRRLAIALAGMILALAAGLAGCRDETPPAAGRAGSRPLPVQVALAEYGPISQSIYVEGTARALRR